MRPALIWTGWALSALLLSVSSGRLSQMPGTLPFIASLFAAILGGWIIGRKVLP